MRSALFILVSFALLLQGCFFFSNDREILPYNHMPSKALEIALEQLGKPYRWGGRGPDLFDCSGLITWSYKKAIGRDDIFRIGNMIYTDATMDDLYSWNVELIPIEEASPGDIVFITNKTERITHGGFFIRRVNEETVEILHASSYHGYTLKENWPIDKPVDDHWFVGIGRLVVAH